MAESFHHSIIPTDRSNAGTELCGRDRSKTNSHQRGQAPNASTRRKVAFSRIVRSSFKLSDTSQSIAKP